MTKLEKLKKDLEKAENTVQNAKKRKKLLEEKIHLEEQKELQNLMASAGVTASDIRELLTDKSPVSQSPAALPEEQGGYNSGE